jgi:hypothetical protein
VDAGGSFATNRPYVRFRPCLAGQRGWSDPAVSSRTHRPRGCFLVPVEIQSDMAICGRASATENSAPTRAGLGLSKTRRKSSAIGAYCAVKSKKRLRFGQLRSADRFSIVAGYDDASLGLDYCGRSNFLICRIICAHAHAEKRNRNPANESNRDDLEMC